jgi:hypothetical protein
VCAYGYGESYDNGRRDFSEMTDRYKQIDITHKERRIISRSILGTIKNKKKMKWNGYIW